MLPLDRRKALEAVIGMNYRVSFRRTDAVGIADFVVDVVASSIGASIEQARWQLEAAHEADHQSYRPVMAVLIERESKAPA